MTPGIYLHYLEALKMGTTIESRFLDDSAKSFRTFTLKNYKSAKGLS